MYTNNCALFEMQTKEALGPDGMELDLLQEIILQLSERGVRFSKIKIGHESLYTRCKIDRTVVTLGVLAATRKPNSSVQCSIHCANHIPFWKRLFKHMSPEAFCSGSAVQYICEEVGKILSSDQRITHIEWLTHNECFRKRGQAFDLGVGAH
jgi:hypothetical protein